MDTTVKKDKKKIRELINKKLDKAEKLIKEAKELAKSINLLTR